MTPRNLYLTGRKFTDLARTEAESYDTYELPLRRRFWLWRRGFLARSDFLYDLDDGWEAYLTDYERFVRTHRINGHWNAALDNKLVFHWMMAGSFPETRPTVFGMLRNGRYLPISDVTPDGTETKNVVANVSGPSVSALDGGTVSATNAAEHVKTLIDHRKRIVLKWTKGGGGHNVYLCSRAEDGGYVVNGDGKSESEFASLVADLDEYVVCDHVSQSDFASNLYERTTNTIRAVTMTDEEGTPFVGIAIYRIGTDRSYPMDNFTQGGLSAEIDVETGELGEAVQLSDTDDPVRYENHPESRTPIAGERIPAWGAIRERLLTITAANPTIQYAGWDIVPTDDEGTFKLLEANSYPGMRSLQIHRPLLADDRIYRFYRRHGVVRR